MLCTKCGHVSPDSARFCAQCGNALTRPRPTPPPSAAQAEKAPSTEKPHEAHARQPNADAAAAAFAAGQTAQKKEEAGRGRSASPGHEAKQTGPATADPQNKQILWLTIVIAALAIAALANWLHSLYSDSREIALSLPPAQSQTPTVSPPPTRLPPTTSASPSTNPRRAPTVVPETSTTAAQEPVIKRKKKVKDAPDTHLNEAEKKQLVARLQRRPAPASCDSAIAMVKQQAHISPSQAREIALRAYPALCAPVAKAEPESPPPPRKVARSIDQVWQDRFASECESGIGGLICGEKLRYKLCEGRWKINPPAGQSICHQQESYTPN